MNTLERIQSDAELLALFGLAESRLAKDPSHDRAHLLRVAEWTVRLAEGVDPRWAIAAALLHDFVPVPKDSPDRARASELSAAEVARVLTERGWPAGAVAEISVAVRTTSFSRGEPPRSALGKALSDADRLDALGVIGVFRTITTGARMNADYYAPEDPWAESRPLDEKAHSLDHFFTKLLRLPERMHSPVARAEAERRAARMRELLGGLGEEIGRPFPGRS